MLKKNPQTTQVDGEHIFPASKLTPLAVQWKQLNAAGRHKEAMLVLEQIVVGSTAMFERLAQFEDFHYTVDLPILVSAAQEKVIKWLAKWNPKKGKLFSWFSAHADTLILLDDGSMRRIADLVAERYSGKVICWNTETSQFERQRVTDWSKEPSRRKDFRKLVITQPKGYSRPVYLTYEHKVWTQTGYKAVDALTPSDTLYLDTPRLTQAGKDALIGLYLGDGSVLNNEFRVTHGKKQRFYNEWLKRKYRGHIYECGNKGWNKFVGKMMDHTGETVFYVNAHELWADYSCLAHPKRINEWVTSRITPLSLAVWYMDDGSYSAELQIATLATMGFTDQERASLQEALRRDHGLVVNIHKNKGLYVARESLPRFFSAIAPHVLREFDYKLPTAYRTVPKIDADFVEDSVELLQHKSKVSAGEPCWEVHKRFKARKGKADDRADEQPGAQKWYGPTTESFNWKYDLTVEGCHNFFAGRRKLLISNSKCSKNAFRSELVKVNQYRKRYHVTGDNLEKFYGADDHEVDKHDAAADVRSRLDDLACRWGDPQEIGAIRFLTLCIIEDDHDKQAAIRSAAYAYGISFELAKFFYNWSVVNLRHAFYERAYVPFTEHDLMLAAESYTFWPEFVNIVGIDKAKECCAKLGGQRIKIPTLQYFAKLRENHMLARDVERSSLDPDAVAEAAKKHKKTPRMAQEVFHEMVEQLDPRRYGEHSIFHEDSAD